jgi:hypothetical protein
LKREPERGGKGRGKEGRKRKRERIDSTRNEKVARTTENSLTKSQNRDCYVTHIDNIEKDN